MENRKPSNISFLRGILSDECSKFKQWIDQLNDEPRISWYPSSGHDFHDVLYFRNDYFRIKNIRKLVQQPDIHIHTDVVGQWYKLPFVTGDSQIFLDRHTSIKAKWTERLKDFDLPVYSSLVVFDKETEWRNRAYVMMLEIESDKLGTFEVPLIYCNVENTAFFAKEILGNKVTLSHIYHMRYGGGCGGGSNSDGFWIIHCLRDVNCEIYISDAHYQRPDNNVETTLFPILKEEEDKYYKAITDIPGYNRDRLRREVRRDVEDGCYCLPGFKEYRLEHIPSFCPHDYRCGYFPVHWYMRDQHEYEHYMRFEKLRD